MDKIEKPSLRQPDTADQIGEARVGADGVPQRRYFEHQKTIRMLLISLFQEDEGLIFLAEACMDKRKKMGRDVSLCRERAEFVEDAERPGALT